MTPGHFPEMSSTDLPTSPLFNSLTSGLSVSPSNQFQYRIHPAPVCLPWSLVNTGATQKMIRRRFRINSFLLTNSLCLCPVTFCSFVFSKPYFIRHFTLNMSMFTVYLCYVFSKHVPHCNTHTYSMSFCALRKSTIFWSITSLKLETKKKSWVYQIVIYLSLPSCVWLERITVGESRDGVYSQEEAGIAPISTLHHPPLPLNDGTLRRLCLHCSAQLRPNVLFV